MESTITPVLKKRQKPKPPLNREISDMGYEPYELITLFFEDGTQQNAWWTGSSWDSLRKITKEPIYWRKHFAPQERQYKIK